MFALALGVVRAFVPNITVSAFRTVFALQWAVGGLATLLFLLVPESPNFLVQKQRFAAAKKALSKIYGPETAGDRMALLVKTIQEEQVNSEIQSGSYLDCFKGTDLKRTLTILFIYIATNVAGAAFLTQNILILITAGLPAIHVFDIGVGGFGLAIVIILLTWAFAGRFRRHNAFLFGCIINLLTMVVIGGLYYAPGQSGLWASAVLMNLLITLQTSIIQGMGWPIAAEISSYRLRSKSLSLATISQAVMAWLTAFVLPYMFNVDSGNLGIRTGFVWAGCSVFLQVKLTSHLAGMIFIPIILFHSHFCLPNGILSLVECGCHCKEEWIVINGFEDAVARPHEVAATSSLVEETQSKGCLR
ncbi:MFS sugar transporter [Ilyonectria robusta]